VGNRRDQNRRPTKAERKEQARLERERIQREMAARSRNRKIGLALVVVAAMGAVAAAVVTNAAGPDLPQPDQLLTTANAAAQQAGCNEVETAAPYGGVADPRSPDYLDQAHIGPGNVFPSMPPLGTYSTVPPASGPHNSVPLSGGTYSDPPPIDQLIHSLEHGAAVIWYDRETPSAQVTRITDFYDQVGGVRADRVIVAPFDYPDQGEQGRLPPGTQMALVAWHRLRSCAEVNLAVAFDFTSQYAFPTFDGRAYQGEAPEQGGAI
jgi:Protein of unknown function (DUF3105)